MFAMGRAENSALGHPLYVEEVAQGESIYTFLGSGKWPDIDLQSKILGHWGKMFWDTSGVSMIIRE